MKEYIPTLLVAFAMLCFAIPLGVAIYEPRQQFTEQHMILGPDVGLVGELIRVKASGDSVRWLVLPETTDTQTFGENNENMVVSFRRNGTYSIIASVHNEDGTHTIHKLEIIISNGLPMPEPDLAPPQNPEPTPAPEPLAPESEIAKAVLKWCNETQPNKDIAAQLANNFLVVAAQIKQGELTDPYEIVARTAELNSKLQLKGFDVVMAGIQSILTQLEESGELSDAERHEHLWRMFASGLLGYVDEK